MRDMKRRSPTPNPIAEKMDVILKTRPEGQRKMTKIKMARYLDMVYTTFYNIFNRDKVSEHTLSVLKYHGMINDKEIRDYLEWYYEN